MIDATIITSLVEAITGSKDDGRWLDFETGEAGAGSDEFVESHGGRVNRARYARTKAAVEALAEALGAGGRFAVKTTAAGLSSPYQIAVDAKRSPHPLDIADVEAAIVRDRRENTEPEIARWNKIAEAERAHKEALRAWYIKTTGGGGDDLGPRAELWATVEKAERDLRALGVEP